MDAAGPAIRFWRRDPDTNTWRPVNDDDALATRTLPEPLEALPQTYAGRTLAPHTLVPVRPSAPRTKPPRSKSTPAEAPQPRLVS